MPLSLFDMSARHVMITGGGTGLGRQFALTLSAAGAHLTLAARRIDNLEATAAEIRATGGSADCVALDVSDAASVTRTFATLRAPLDVLINNAGAAADRMLLEITEDEWDRVMDANLKGAWLVARAAAQQMIAGGRGGSIINIASILGSAVQKATAPYSAAKAGLIQLTRSMALEWARHGIRVNALAPGYYHTDMASDYLESETGARMIKRIPQRRLGEPGELAGAILLLASAASSYMTGSVLTVDGGLSLAVI
ncbi:MAG: SDR family oxidoreductase [Gammaproteobacteria bacterium]|jgi:NAD(P)-dependent dehydrogenase (short-subunit alcohol dehydrogenase family)|nr:SDR family oxidoreductase [Gammaproteobacteria bacterium]MBP6050734.1 SDR family oxidoreductase [Pseudomonadales bacterium]MBK6584476.1 SDR family oxidoreductase [Gammaproteobacteria bacterium]MBK7168287.1 SDR family oxidoreductase [Gammaproteobacteria bacterium]MBK7520934.1 SDR family oxidoreductase [Gammaproteobacteria bacterium]